MVVGLLAVLLRGIRADVLQLGQPRANVMKHKFTEET
jgi:hypothetical protein